MLRWYFDESRRLQSRRFRSFVNDRFSSGGLETEHMVATPISASLSESSRLRDEYSSG